MARGKVYLDTDTTETTDTAAQSSNGAAGWEDAPTATATGKHKGRHVDDGNGICVKCGQPITQRTSTLGRPRSSNSLTIEMVASMMWLGGGIGLEHLPQTVPVIGVIAKPVEREDGSEGASPAKAAGRVMQLEAAIAGKRIDRAVRGTVVGKFINALLNISGPWAELVPLFLPPLLLGGAAAFPALVERFPVLKGMMVATMLPVLTEAAKLAEQQGALMQNLQSVNEETIAQTVNVIQDILSDKSTD
jgi:hypothetical protein